MKWRTRVPRLRLLRPFGLLAALTYPLLAGAGDTSLQTILDRLDRLEGQNRALLEEVRALRDEVRILRGSAVPVRGPERASATDSGPTVEERMAVAESRIEEQAQTKVEASQRFPIRLTGMALANAFTNSRYSGGLANPTVASLYADGRTAGGTVRQSVIGLEYRGPSVPGGGKVSGSLFMDFYGGEGDTLNQYFRIRTGSVRFDWEKTSLVVGQEKPIVSPREPNSLAQVGVSPLTNAGNLWLWQPQARLEQRFTLGEGTQLEAQAGVYQLRETAAIVPSEYASSVAESRPALQGRFAFSHQSPGDFRIEIAPSVHGATSHVAGASVPSRMVSVDWFLRPLPKLELTGMVFRGKNIAGMGALRQGFQIVAPGDVRPVHSVGGWSQITWRATRRVTLNIFGGQQDDRNSELPIGGFGKNQAYGGNVMIRVAPNVILSFENLRTWTSYVGSANRRNNHYDLAVAYLF